MRDGIIAAWPLRAAPAGPFPGGTGTVANPFNGMCVTLAADRAAVVAWTCSPGASTQQWTSYSDGTLRTGGRCLDLTGPGAGARARRGVHRGAQPEMGDRPGVLQRLRAPHNTGTGTVLTYPGGSTTAPRWSSDPTTATSAARGTSPSTTT